jgi:hypothetical protein
VGGLTGSRLSAFEQAVKFPHGYENPPTDATMRNLPRSDGLVHGATAET